LGWTANTCGVGDLVRAKTISVELAGYGQHEARVTQKQYQRPRTTATTDSLDRGAISLGRAARAGKPWPPHGAARLVCRRAHELGTRVTETAPKASPLDTATDRTASTSANGCIRARRKGFGSPNTMVVVTQTAPSQTPRPARSRQGDPPDPRSHG